MRNFQSHSNIHKIYEDKNTTRYTLLDRKENNLESERIINLSRKNQDDIIASNSIILSIISNALDLNKDEKNKSKVRKSNEKYSSHIKTSSYLNKTSKIHDSTKTLKNDNNKLKRNNLNYNVISNNNTNNMNSTNNSTINKQLTSNNRRNTNFSVEHSSAINQMRKFEDQKSSIEILSAKDLLNKRNRGSINSIHYSNYSNRKLDVNKRSYTMRCARNKNKKFKETIYSVGKAESIIKKRKTNKQIRKTTNKLLNSNNLRRESALLSIKNFKRSSKNCLMTFAKEKEEKNANEIMAILAFREIHKKLKNNMDENIKDKLYKYENNAITDAINKLPSIKMENKSIKNIKIMDDKQIEISEETHNDESNITNINMDKSDNKICLKVNNREKHRILNLKGNVYDSLDDEEIIEEIVDSLFLTPDSEFLLVFDSVIMISSFILLIYFPLYLAKTMFFCRSVLNFNNILFHLIDIIYTIGLILGFFRAYYNFDEILVRNGNKICKSYLNTWF